MNIYLIDNAKKRHGLLPEILRKCNHKAGAAAYHDGFVGNGPTAWKNADKIISAIRDVSGILLLDLHLPCRDANEIVVKLLSEFESEGMSVKPTFEATWKQFDKEAEFQISALVLALVQLLNLRVVVTSTHGKPLPSNSLPAQVAASLNFRTVGFVPVLNPGDQSDPKRAAGFESSLEKLGNAILSVSDNYDSAETNWCVLSQKLTSGPWHNHPCQDNNGEFFCTGWHNAKDWLRVLAEDSDRVSAVLAEASSTLERYVSGIQASVAFLSNKQAIIILLKAASRGWLSVDLVKSLVGLHEPTEMAPPFPCLGSGRTQSVGRLAKALICLTASKGPNGEAFKAEVAISNRTVILEFRSKCVDITTAQSVCATLQLKPQQRRIRDNRATVGEAVEACEWLRETAKMSRITAVKDEVYVRAEFPLFYVS